MNTDNLTLWDYSDTLIEDLDIEVPDFITHQDTGLSCSDVAGIMEGGCAGQAYMPACTYHIANSTMAEHGNEVLQYIEDTLGELPHPPAGESWQGMAVFYLSSAIELYCSSIADEALDAIVDNIIEPELKTISDQWPTIRAMVVDQYGEDDTCALDQAFNDWTDSLCKDAYVYNNVTREDIEAR